MCSLQSIWTARRWYGPRGGHEKRAETRRYCLVPGSPTCWSYPVGTVRSCSPVDSSQGMHSTLGAAVRTYHSTSTVPTRCSIEAQWIDRDSGGLRGTSGYDGDGEQGLRSAEPVYDTNGPVAPVLTTRPEPNAGSLTTSASAVCTTTASSAPRCDMRRYSYHQCWLLLLAQSP